LNTQLILGLITSILFASQVCAFDIDVGRFTLNSGTGTQNLSFANFDEDCTSVTCAVIFFMSSATADATATAGRIINVGFADGTSEISSYGEDDDGLGTTNSDRRISSNEVIEDNPQALSINFSAWLSDGVQINIGATTGVQHLVNAVIFGGSTLSADVGSFTSNASIDGTTDVTSVGFTSDLVFLTGVRTGTINSGGSNHIFTMGIALNDGSDTQGSIGCYSRDNQATSDVHAVTSSLYAAQHTDNSGLDQAIQIGTFDSSGFTSTTKIAGTAYVYGYLALEIGALDSSLVDISTPTSTGNDSVTIGHASRFGLILGTLAQAFDTDEADSDGGSCMFSIMTSDAQYVIGNASEDNVGTSNTQSYNDDIAIYMSQDDGSCSAGSCFTGTLSSFDNTSWNFNYSATFTDAARKWLGFAIEGDATDDRRRSDNILQ
jgi:hypothetical protein